MAKLSDKLSELLSVEWNELARELLEIAAEFITAAEEVRGASPEKAKKRVEDILLTLEGSLIHLQYLSSTFFEEI